jgi:hypothetical protein
MIERKKWEDKYGVPTRQTVEESCTVSGPVRVGTNPLLVFVPELTVL